MKFSMGQAEFSQAVALAGQNVSSKSTLPVLGNLLLSADREDGAVTVTGTNLESALAVVMPAEVAESGAITLPARLLRDALAGIPDKARVDAELSARTMTVTLAYFVDGRPRGEVHIKGIDAIDFPLIPVLGAGTQMEFSGADLSQLIKRSAFAASSKQDTSRPALTGVLVTEQAGRLVLAATDGYRLAIARRDTDVTLNQQVIAPAAALALADKLAGLSDSVTLTVDGSNRLQFVCSGGNRGWREARLITQTIDAKFPDYTAIMPKQAGTVVKLDAGEFGRALKMAALFAEDSSNRVRLHVAPGLAPELSHLTVSAESAESGRFATDLDAEITGPELEIVLNVAYLQAGLGPLVEEVAVLEFTKAERPCLLRGTGYEYVVMPMQSR